MSYLLCPVRVAGAKGDEVAIDTNVGLNLAESFAELDTTMQISNMLTFLYVARRGVCSQKDIELALGLSNAASSRNISYWCERKRYGVEGHGFINREIDPKDNRQKILSLTDEGQEFYRRLREGSDSVKQFLKSA